MNKGQVTIIIFLAVLIFISFSLVFYLFSINQPDFEQGNEDIEYFSNQWEIQLQECTEQAIKETLLTWGAQGGIIFDNQSVNISGNITNVSVGGILPFTDRREFVNGQEVLVRIKEPTTPAPLPANFDLSQDITATISSLVGDYPVCDANYPDGCSANPSTPNCFCRCTGPICGNSTLGQFKRFVNAYVTTCYNPITDDTVQELSYDLQTDVQINTQSVTTSSSSVANVTIDNIQQQTTVNAGIEVNVQLLEFLDDLNIVLKIQENSERGKIRANFSQEMLKTFPNLQVSRSDIPGMNIIHFELRETSGNVLGRPLTFNYARENRAPIVVDVPIGDQVVTAVSDEFQLPFCFADPDEDSLDTSSFIEFNTTLNLFEIKNDVGDIIGISDNTSSSELPFQNYAGVICQYRRVNATNDAFHSDADQDVLPTTDLNLGPLGDYRSTQCSNCVNSRLGLGNTIGNSVQWCRYYGDCPRCLKYDDLNVDVNHTILISVVDLPSGRSDQSTISLIARNSNGKKYMLGKRGGCISCCSYNSGIARYWDGNSWELVN